MDLPFWLSVTTLLVVLSLWMRPARPPGDSMTLRRLERKLDLILNHFGLEADQGLTDKLLQLRDSGQKIAAIKLYRDHSGVGLKEAKDFVEAL